MKNLLHKTKTYLVGHMQYLEGRDWRGEVADKLGALGITCFNPYNKPFIKDVEEDESTREEMEVWMKTKQYDRVSERMKCVRSYDLNLVDRSDFIIAHLVPDVASWGSAEEIVTAVRMKKPIFVSVVGNHSLDYGVQGHRNTVQFLKRHLFLTNSKQKVESNGIVFLNATDHCGCENPGLWAQHILMIDYDNLQPIFQRISKLKDKFIVFSIHWDKNYIKGDMPQHIQDFGKALIDHGVNIVFGHSAHHIVKNPVQ